MNDRPQHAEQHCGRTGAWMQASFFLLALAACDPEDSGGQISEPKSPPGPTRPAEEHLSTALFDLTPAAGDRWHSDLTMPRLQLPAPLGCDGQDLGCADAAYQAASQREHAVYEAILRGLPLPRHEGYYGEHVSLTQPSLSHQLGQNSVCLVSHSTPSIDGYAHLSEKNHNAYASRWGYHMLKYRGLRHARNFMNGDCAQAVHRYGFYWQKIVAVQEALAAPALNGSGPLCQWVMWLDADTLITDMSRPVEDILSTYNKPIVLSREQTQSADERQINIMNAGVFFVANDRSGRQFVADVLNLFPRFKDAPWGDQDAILHHAFNLDDFPHRDVRALPWEQAAEQLRADVAVAPARDFDGFYHEGPPPNDVGFWQPGDFLAHFAGLDFKSRLRAMRQMLADLARKDGVL